MTDVDTKEKIMNVARILFADNGYEGTSVREIAKVADVNVASLNYYFSSKEKLFLEILEKGYNDCSIEMQRLMEKNQGNLENTLIDFFRYFMEHSHDLVSQFKMMMSSQHSYTIPSAGQGEAMYGPPGGMFIAEVLKKESPNASEGDIHWALKTLFSHVTHISLIQNCCLKHNKNVPFSTQEDLEKGIRRITRIVLSELKAPRHSLE